MISMDRRSILFREGAPASVAVFRALQFGDLLCTVPAFRALRASLPDARITLIGLPWAREFVARFSRYLDDFMEFPGYPGLPEKEPDIQMVPEFFRAAQEKRFDLAIQLHGSGSYVNSITMLLAAHQAAGFYLEGEFCPDPARFMPWPSEEHEIRKYLRLLEFLGIPVQGDHLEFPVTPQDEMEFHSTAGTERLTEGSYVCIHPGARLLTRRWLPERFAAVADALHAEGLTIVLTGTHEELALVRSVEHSMHHVPLNLAGKTTPGALAVLLRRARLLLTNDTGVSHVAAALRVPSVIMVLGSDPTRWRPLDTRRHLILSKDVTCRPCYHMRCPIGHPCAYGIETEDVLRTAGLLLERYHIPSRALEHPLGAAAGAGKTPEQRLSQQTGNQSERQREE
jgi:ADP-heptose:LPS heptosyltransferase